MMSRKCLFPFTNLTINTNGSAAPCCKYNIIKVESRDLEKVTLYEKNIKELFFQPSMNDIREKFLNNIEPKECSACWDEEASGIISMRQHLHNVVTDEKKRQKYIDKFNNPSIVSLDFKFSSLCNLKCRICGPYCSSKWLQESLDTNEYHEHTIKIFAKYADRKFIDNEVNFDIFEEILPTLHKLEFYGGEPLLQPEHKKIMDILDNYSNLSDIKLTLLYNTNGTIFDEQTIDVWKKVAYVGLNISIDDIFERFEYQRFLASWDLVLDNIKKYKQHCGKNVQISLYCTVSAYNIFYIDEFIKFNAEHLKLPIRFNLLHQPVDMSIANIPESVKKIVADKINNLSDNEKFFIDKSFDIDGVINFMLNNTADKDLFNKFMEKNKIHDDYRKQSFETTFSEYWSLLNVSN
jgi:molybdenum cofactor biosynthesis enzyme MoaA